MKKYTCAALDVQVGRHDGRGLPVHRERTGAGNLERVLQQAAQPAVQGVADQLQQLLDRLGRQYEGQQVEAIKPVLQAEWSRVNGGSIRDPELSEWAQHISDGRRIEMRTR